LASFQLRHSVDVPCLFLVCIFYILLCLSVCFYVSSGPQLPEIKHKTDDDGGGDDDDFRMSIWENNMGLWNHI